jgi:hypothetical protein
MFFIINKTKQTVVLADLGVTLGPRQAIDLDKVVSRSKSDSSKMLKMAQKKGDIEIRSKDGEVKNAPIKKDKSNDLEAFKNEIVGEMKSSFKDAIKKQSVNVQGGVSEEQLERMMQRLIKSMPKNTTETVFVQSGGEKTERTDEEIEIDEDKLAEMNKRVVDKMMESVKSGDIKHNEEIQKNDLDKNITELEGLLDL